MKRILNKIEKFYALHVIYYYDNVKLKTYHILMVNNLCTSTTILNGAGIKVNLAIKQLLANSH